MCFRKFNTTFKVLIARFNAELIDLRFNMAKSWRKKVIFVLLVRPHKAPYNFCSCPYKNGSKFSKICIFWIIIKHRKLIEKLTFFSKMSNFPGSIFLKFSSLFCLFYNIKPRIFWTIEKNEPKIWCRVKIILFELFLIKNPSQINFDF